MYGAQAASRAASALRRNTGPTSAIDATRTQPSSVAPHHSHPARPMLTRRWPAAGAGQQGRAAASGGTGRGRRRGFRASSAPSPPRSAIPHQDRVHGRCCRPLDGAHPPRMRAGTPCRVRRRCTGAGRRRGRRGNAGSRRRRSARSATVGPRPAEAGHAGPEVGEGPAPTPARRRPPIRREPRPRRHRRDDRRRTPPAGCWARVEGTAPRRPRRGPAGVASRPTPVAHARGAEARRHCRRRPPPLCETRQAVPRPACSNQPTTRA